MTMPDSPDTRQMERAADDARARVRNDIAALGDEVRADRAAAQSRLHDNAAAIAGGAAALGALIGIGGRKAVKALVGVGLAAGAAWFYMRQRP